MRCFGVRDIMICLDQCLWLAKVNVKTDAGRPFSSFPILALCHTWYVLQINIALLFGISIA